MNEKFVDKINYVYENYKTILGSVDKTNLVCLENLLFNNNDLQDCFGYNYFEKIKNNTNDDLQAETRFFKNYYNREVGENLNYSIILLQQLYLYMNTQKNDLETKNKKLNILDKYANYVRNMDAKNYNLDTNISCGVECNIDNLEVFASQTDAVTTFGRTKKFNKNMPTMYQYEQGTLDNDFIEYCNIHDMDLKSLENIDSLVK